MRIAVTGSTGFIGGYMARGLSGAGHDLRLLVRPGREGAAPQLDGATPELFTGDLSDPGSLKGFLDDCQLLIHIAGAHDHLDDEEMRAVNIGGTEALLEDAARCGYGDSIGAPVYSYYRDSKRIQEKLIRGSGINWTSFRPTLVYGVGDMRHTAPLLRQCAQTKGTIWVPHDGKSKINPVHVDDVVDAVLRFFDFDRGVDCCYELAGPEGLPYNHFLDRTIEAVGGKVRRRNISKTWADRLIFLKGLFTDVTEDRRASAYFMLHHQHDITNAVDELGWSPRSYVDGIREVAQGDWWHE